MNTNYNWLGKNLQHVVKYAFKANPQFGILYLFGLMDEFAFMNVIGHLGMLAQVECIFSKKNLFVLFSYMTVSIYS